VKPIEYRLICRNLPWSINSADKLAKLFEPFGKVAFSVLPRKGGGSHGPLRGFGFVNMRDKEQAQKAIDDINGKEINGRVIAVDWAVEKNVWEEKVKEEEPEHDYDAEVPENDDDDSEDEDEEDEEDEEGSEKEAEEDDEDDTSYQTNDPSTTIFIRNLPFTCTDTDLHAHFTEHFGPVKYARTVMDYETDRPRGTAFVAFYDPEVCRGCVQNAPPPPPPGSRPTILQNESADPT